MSLISLITRPKKMSMKHWRYRLMHWTFHQRKPSHYSLSKMPTFLYTHYCPLFHLTNILILALPLTLLWRALYHSYVGLKWVGVRCGQILSGSPRLRQIERMEITMRELFFKRELHDFDAFWYTYKWNYHCLTEEEAQEYYIKFKTEFENVKAQREAIKKKVYWLIYAGQCSIKIGKYLGIAVLAIIVLLAAFVGLLHLYSAMSWLWVTAMQEPTTFIYFGGAAGWLIVLVGWLVWRRTSKGKLSSKWFAKFDHLLAGFLVCSLVLFALPFILCWKFFSSFYESHCPPIELSDCVEL